MAEEESNLSEKITALFNELPVHAEVGYRTEIRDKIDLIIKEFIKMLKKWGRAETLSGKKILVLTEDELDKLAGDRLI